MFGAVTSTTAIITVLNMTDLNKIAAVLDRLRIVPRLIVVMYGILFYQVAMWFMSLVAPTGPQATFVSVIVGAAGVIFGFYVNSGNRQE